ERYLTMPSRREIVEQAIAFNYPSRVPLWFVNCDQTDGDVMVYHLSLNRDEETGDNEWGYHLESLDDGTMGHPISPFLPDWETFANFAKPPINAQRRMQRLPEFLKEADDRYLLASLDLSGFTVYTLLRGFENSMIDFMVERGRFTQLMDMIVDFEMELTTLAAQHGFHGIHFVDDWATQTGLMISPKLWRELFKPYYKRQFDHAHREGLHVWYHCCGNFTEIVDDFHEIGTDVLNISQPNVVDIDGIGQRLRGKQCFLMPISYQTVSISGTTEEIYAEARRLYNRLAGENGGFIGYIEEYGCMGMSPDNYRACAEAFRQLQ
ncbi:MAG: hypothetical protein FWH27_18390, partial [Planctomycetaceae bacterium]|nr:hypothetical protein [Planctomycetaceae bacterium]